MKKLTGVANLRGMIRRIWAERPLIWQGAQKEFGLYHPSDIEDLKFETLVEVARHAGIMVELVVDYYIT